jgi:hypothetical protein
VVSRFRQGLDGSRPRNRTRARLTMWARLEHRPAGRWVYRAGEQLIARALVILMVKGLDMPAWPGLQGMGSANMEKRTSPGSLGDLEGVAGYGVSLDGDLGTGRRRLAGDRAFN